MHEQPGIVSMSKIYPDAKAALAGLLFDNMTIMAGGFGLCGIPEHCIRAIKDAGTTGAGWCCPHTALPRPSGTCQRADPAGAEYPDTLKRPHGHP